MFCVECGKEGETYDGLCAECHLKKRRLISLPKVVDVQVCVQCYSVRIGKNWTEVPSIEKAIERAIQEKIDKHDSVKVEKIALSLIQRDQRNYLAKVAVDFKAGELKASISGDIDIRLKNDVCQRCGKRSGHYYEAIIQLRGPADDKYQDRLAAARREIVSRVERMSHDSREIFISKEERIHGGFDFYVSSNSVAKAIAKDLTKSYGATSKSSISMAGRKDGQDLTRTTYLVRLPDYEPGDILLIDGKHYSLKAMEGSSLSVVSLDTWLQTHINLGKLSDLQTFKRNENVCEVQVVSETETEIQVLDPDTYKTIDIVKPPKSGKMKPPVFIFKTENRTYLAP